MHFSSYLYTCTMPIGISNIIKMNMPAFFSADELARRVDAYFSYTEGEYHLENKAGKESKDEEVATKKVWDRDPEPATYTGLALFLGFKSRQEFDNYEEHGAFASILNRGRLRVEAGYEKKLHHQSPAGAIFALKSMGWNEKPENKTTGSEVVRTLKIEIIETGPKPAENEKEVVL
jgi:hypothetical protein